MNGYSDKTDNGLASEISLSPTNVSFKTRTVLCQY